MMALMTVAMMVVMMLPSVAPTLWRHHRRLRELSVSRAGGRTMLFAVGYASVWATIALALVAIDAELIPMHMSSSMGPPLAPWLAGTVVLCAGALQLSGWKLKQLHRCRDACCAARPISTTAMTAWIEGCRLGVDCVLSCAAPMAVLWVAGLMDARMMVVITAAITGERVAPGGARIARLTGALALIAGLALCVQAIELTIA